MHCFSFSHRFLVLSANIHLINYHEVNNNATLEQDDSYEIHVRLFDLHIFVFRSQKYRVERANNNVKNPYDVPLRAKAHSHVK